LASKKESTHALDVFLVSFGAILLEISFTRIIAFKLFYHFTFLIIGVALLGLGSGGVLVAISRAVTRAALHRVVAISALVAALATAIGYWVIALIPLNGLDFWSSLTEPLNLAVMCGALYLPFAAVGVLLSSVFGRHPEIIGRIYAYDLLGAGLACALAIPLLGLLTPPACVFVAAVTFAVVAVRAAGKDALLVRVAGAAVMAACAFVVARPSLLPEPVTDALKTVRPETPKLFSAWNPVFRIDVTENPFSGRGYKVIHHDGLTGSTLHEWDGRESSLGRFDADLRAFAFAVADRRPKNILIIGAAGGHEILAALHFEAERITAVELNSTTVSLLTDVFADFTGNIARHPKVRLINDEGRTFLARNKEKFDLVFFVAPDSYSAMNAASSAAFVLAESYLYTAEMIGETLDHLSDDGLICMHFGEYHFLTKPNRTMRYLSTAREAFAEHGIDDFSEHALVATSPSLLEVSTMLLKKSPFTASEKQRFLEVGAKVPGTVPRYVAGSPGVDERLQSVIELPTDRLDAWHAEYPYQVGAVRDDSPFFWHFARFAGVIRGLGGRTPSFDTEDSAGERSLLGMLAIAIVFAAVLLLLPFVTIRDVWRKLPRKGVTAAYFAALGLGFMFYEIVLIQKLVLYLGYPTYSLTITLMSVLISTGVGSLVIQRHIDTGRAPIVPLLAALVVMTGFYLGVSEGLFAATLGLPLPARVLIVIACIAPLGLILGCFMPLGLSAVARLGTEHADEYVAWSWAVNGFFSVIGSVATTILSMSFGFNVVMTLALGVYGVALVALVAIRRPMDA
jgi:hypothetical protein